MSCTVTALPFPQTPCKRIGRLYEDAGGLHCDLGACGVELSLVCRGEVFLVCRSELPVYFQAFVDGERALRPRVLGGAESFVRLTDALGEGEHTLRIIRETDVDFSGGTTVLCSLYGALDPDTVRATPMRERFFEIVGDSVVVGKGSLAHRVYTADDPCHSATNGFGYLAGDRLGDFSVFARGGIAYCRRTEHIAKTIDEIYPYYNGFLPTPVPYDFPRRPDAVIVHCGVNDTGHCTDEEFSARFRAFTAQIRSYYGDVPIVHAYNTVGDRRNALIERLCAEAGLFAVKLLADDGGSSSRPGSLFHPCAAAQAKNAIILADAVNEIISAKI